MSNLFIAIPVTAVMHRVTTVNLSIVNFIFFILRLGILGLSKFVSVIFLARFLGRVLSLSRRSLLQALLVLKECKFLFRYSLVESAPCIVHWLASRWFVFVLVVNDCNVCNFATSDCVKLFALAKSCSVFDATLLQPTCHLTESFILCF